MNSYIHSSSFVREESNTPIDLVASFASRQEWYVYDRNSDYLCAEVKGRWSSYNLKVKWDEMQETLSVICSNDVTAHHGRLAEMALLATLLNNQFQFGHLELNEQRGGLEMRYALILRGACGVTPEQAIDVVDVLIGESEQVYPGIRQVANGELDARSAAATVIMITKGEA